MQPLTLTLAAPEYAICRLPPTEPTPSWSQGPHFCALIRTPDELSILCPAGRVPGDVRHERGWRLFKFQGPFAFTETGILVSVLTPLAQARVGILALSTFDTDYVLVKAAQLTEACAALTAAGHVVQT